MRFGDTFGEAASGFATARRHALPAFRRARAAGLPAAPALHAALLELLAENADTNVVSRGGLEGLAFVAAGRTLPGGDPAHVQAQALVRVLLGHVDQRLADLHGDAQLFLQFTDQRLLRGLARLAASVTPELAAASLMSALKATSVHG